MHLALEYNIPALAPSVRIRSATSGQPSPPVGRPVNLAQHITTSPAASLTGAVGGINEIVASARNSNEIWKANKLNVRSASCTPQPQCQLVYIYHVCIDEETWREGRSSLTFDLCWHPMMYPQQCMAINVDVFAISLLFALMMTEKSARFSEPKLVTENSVFHLCRSQLRSEHFENTNIIFTPT